MKRTWGVAEQKIVSARQNWRCKLCGCVLPSSFELDHVVPLWAGGEDDYETNAQSICPTCHATKTQRESMQRAVLTRKRRAEAIAEAVRNEPEVDDCLSTPKGRIDEQGKNPRIERTVPARPTSPLPPFDPLLDNNPFLKYAFSGKSLRR